MGLGAILTINNIPEASLSGASEVIVHEKLGDISYYEIRYVIDILDNDISHITESNLDPGSEIGILVQPDTTASCLIKGPVFSQNVHFEHGGTGSYVLIRGADSSIKMARELKSQNWANVTDSEVVTSILGTYGLIPDVSSTNSRHIETKHSLVQRASDYDFIRKLGKRNGYLFWIDTNALGIETAHFKRPELTGSTEVDIIINQSENNTESLDLMWDVEAPISIEGLQVDLGTKMSLSGQVISSPQNPLGTTNLQGLTGDTRSINVAAPSDDAGDMTSRSESALIEAEWFINAKCRASLHQLNSQLVRAGNLVNVVGAGSRHSGTYLVSAVKHMIDATAHVMELDLIRNAWN